MTEKDTHVLLEQICNIILNKPVEWEMEENSGAVMDLQKAVSYLSQCLMESNQLLKNLAEGNLDVPLPDRHNFLAGELKQLHAALKHLTWQTGRVLQGDYKQRVNFMGEFSRAFNEMVIQLEKRESELKNQAKKNEQFNTLLVSVMDSLKEWVVVTEDETGDILYTNELARRRFFEFRPEVFCCGDMCTLLNELMSHTGLEHELRYEFQCPNSRYFQIKSFPTLWNDRKAVVHLITDITYQKENEAFLEAMAYKDELTGLNNRRRCLDTIASFMRENTPFSVCMIDMDELKNVNDQFGHMYGDEYIRNVSQAIKEIIRDVDFAYRFGGDEFVVLFRSYKAQTARSKLRIIDKKMSDIQADYPMSISYGVFYVDPGQNLTPDMVLNLADERMYRFKRRRKKLKNGVGKH